MQVRCFSPARKQTREITTCVLLLWGNKRWGKASFMELSDLLQIQCINIYISIGASITTGSRRMHVHVVLEHSILPEHICWRPKCKKWSWKDSEWCRKFEATASVYFPLYCPDFGIELTTVNCVDQFFFKGICCRSPLVPSPKRKFTFGCYSSFLAVSGLADWDRLLSALGRNTLEPRHITRHVQRIMRSVKTVSIYVESKTWWWHFHLEVPGSMLLKRHKRLCGTGAAKVRSF